MKSWLSRKILQWWGWEILGEFPKNAPKNVVIPIPHTTNWDFPIGVLLRPAYNIDIKYVGKSALFKPPFGFIMRWLGGIPVDRSKNNNFVDAVIETYKHHDELSICIAPEGTRNKVDRLKTGFYHIAVGANVPIVMIKFDWGNKIIEWSAPFYPTGNQEADFEVIYDYFDGVKGKIPENSFDRPKS